MDKFLLLSLVVAGGSCVHNDSRCDVEQDCHELLNEWTRTRDRQYDASERVVVERMTEYLPRWDPSVAAAASPRCRRQADQYLRGLARLQLWALKMYDATAKTPSGLLNGNVNQLGDFDQCLSVSHGAADNADAAGDIVRGKYCLASIQLHLNNATDTVRVLHRLLHANYAFRSELDDPGHRVPKFSSINWGVCVPAGCSHGDVEAAMAHYLGRFMEGTNVEFAVRVRGDMCHVREDTVLPLGTVISGLIFGCVLLAVTLATLLHHYGANTNRYLLSLSLKHNVCKLTRSSPDDIGCVHGIRFVNSLMLIVSHKSMAVMFVPFSNRTDMSVDIGKPWTVVSRAASLYTDPFIMFSGLLTTYSILRRLKRTGRICLYKEYVSRLVRILPSFGALIVFCTWLMPLLSSGPFWNQVVSSHADICKKYWWRNMLFIHNYFGFENMCLTHTHHIGIDTQLFLATPPLVLLLWRRPGLATRLLAALAVLSTVARYAVTYSLQLSNYVFYGTSVKQLFDTADYMYILPAHRATVYIMGVLLGYLLHNSKNVALSKIQLRLGWTAATAMLLSSFLSPAGMGNIDYQYDATQAASYAAFAPIAWCAFFAWVIYTAQLGHTSTVSKLLSWPGYAAWTKISYSVYLTQFPIFFYTVGVVRTPQEYDFISQLVNVKEITMIVLTSLALTLLVEFPCQNIKEALMTRPTKSVISVTEKIPEEKEYNVAVSIIEKYRHIDTDKTK